jgi:iron complex outermembrane recepter protein
MGKSQLLGSTALLAIAVSAVSLRAAYAQDTVKTVERIVVTAERRTQDMQTAPISVTVLNEKMLEDKGVVNLTTLQYAAPGIKISDYASANTFNIRGIGQSQVDIDLPSGVAIYRDGVPTLTGYFQNAPYYDMASVEVLRGPQGTFSGKSASAGAVYIRTRDPELDEITSSLMGGVGNYGFYEWTGIFNRPIGDELALRVAVHGERRDSLFDNIFTNPLPGNIHYGGPFQGDDNRRLDSIRGGLKWQPTEAFTAVFKLDIDDLYFGSHATSGMVRSGPDAGVEEDVSNPIANGPHKYVDRGQRSSLKLTYELEDGIEINSLSGYSFVKTRANWDSNGSRPEPGAFLSGGKFENISQEFNIISPSDQRFTWVVGLFGQSYRSVLYPEPEDGFELHIGNDLPPPLFPVTFTELAFYSTWKKHEHWYAAFGEIEYDLTDQLEVEVGARVGHYEFVQFTQAFLDFSGGIVIPFNQPPGGVTDPYEEDEFDWKVALNYQINDDHFVYGLVSRGHTVGSVNIFSSPLTPVTGHHTAYDPMKVLNYELGWKGTFVDEQVLTQMNVYYQTFDGYQANFALTTPGIPVIDTIGEFKNAKTESIIYGVELGIQASFEDWTFDAGFAYSKSKLGSFGTILNVFDPVFGGGPSIDLDGAKTPFAPEVTANAGVAYTFLIGDEGGEPTKVTPRIDVAYWTDSYANLFQNRATLLEGQTLLNGSVRVEAAEDWEIFFWGSNLTDERFAAAKQNVAGNGGALGDEIVGIVYMAPPRLLGVRVTHDF